MIKIKTHDQIEGIREAGIVAADCLDHLQKFIIAGTTTEELNEYVAYHLESKGAIAAPLNYKGFPKESCISLNEVICHGIPSKRKLKKGDILNVDVTAILNGYYGDTSRMYTVGEVSKEAQDLIDITKECLNIGIAQVYPGNRFGNIGYAIGTFAMSAGYSVVYQFCGHGVGLEFHEEPNISHISQKDTGEIMERGMVFTIEPMICIKSPEAVINEADGWTASTIDGGLSAQFEHTIAVTVDGFEILTLPYSENNSKVQKAWWQ